MGSRTTSPGDSYNWRITPQMLGGPSLVRQDRSWRGLLVQSAVTLAVGLTLGIGLHVTFENLATPVSEPSAPLRDRLSPGAHSGHIALLIATVLTTGTLIVMNLVRLLGLRRLVLTPERVSYRRVRFGRVAADWSEPLTQYRGVQGRIVRTGRDSEGDVLRDQVIELVHSSPEKTLLLSRRSVNVHLEQSQAALAMRGELADCGKALHLPALVSDEGGDVVPVSPEDLEEPVGELVREGKMTLGEWAEQPPEDLILESISDGVCITIGPPRRRQHLTVMLGFIATAGVAALIGAFLDWVPNEGWMGVAATVLACLAFMLIEMCVGTRVYITATSVTAVSITRWNWEFRARTVSLHEVRSVSAADDPQPPKPFRDYWQFLMRGKPSDTDTPLDRLLGSADSSEGPRHGRVTIVSPGRTLSFPTARPAHAAWIRGLILHQSAAIAPPPERRARP